VDHRLCGGRGALAVGLGAWLLSRRCRRARLVYGNPPAPTAVGRRASLSGLRLRRSADVWRLRDICYGARRIVSDQPDRLVGRRCGAGLVARRPHIAFVSVRDTLSGKLDWIGRDLCARFRSVDRQAGGRGQAAHRLAGCDGWPAWSPSGDQIAFHSDRSGNFDIWVMGSDGSNPVNLTNIPATTSSRLVPDGSKIAFASDRDGSYDIWTTNPDGSSLSRLTDSPARDRYPIWSPDGARLTSTPIGTATRRSIS